MAGKTFQKAIIFINSVSQVVEIIKDTGLDKSECGIICGDTVKNDLKIRGINRYNASLEMPKYLFITSSGFCGIDIKDNSAMPIVVSNTAKSWQMIDILTDLKQAVSRQRDKTNPNYGYYIFIYKQSIFKKSESELIEILDKIYEKIKSGIEIYKAALNIGEEEGFMMDNNFKAYTSFNGYEYTINENAFNADKYFILEIRNQYTKGFDINGKLGNAEIIEPIELPKSVTYIDLVEYFNENNKNGVIDWSQYSVKTN